MASVKLDGITDFGIDNLLKQGMLLKNRTPACPVNRFEELIFEPVPACRG
jgi:hypothetical protein